MESTGLRNPKKGHEYTCNRLTDSLIMYPGSWVVGGVPMET